MFIEEELHAYFDSLISLVNNFEKNAENAPPAMVTFFSFSFSILLFFFFFFFYFHFFFLIFWFFRWKKSFYSSMKIGKRF